MLYLAYGSNLNIKQMKIRCPYAKPSGTFYMPNYRLVFRRVADITKSEGNKVPIGVWKITKQCEIALDRYEGYPTLYRKEYISLNEIKQKYKPNEAKLTEDALLETYII